MKKNNERIMEYLSGMMNPEEQKVFESELPASEQLKNDYKLITDKLKNIDSELLSGPDEQYFTGLLPKVRERLEKKNWFLSGKLPYYAASTAVAVIIMALLLFKSPTGFESQYKELSDVVLENFSDKDVSEKYFSELESSQDEVIITSSSDDPGVEIPSGLEVLNDSYTRLIDNPIANEYNTLNRLSDQDLEIVFNNLNINSTAKVTK